MPIDALRSCPFCDESDFDAIGLRAHLRDCAAHMAVPSKAAETRVPSEPSELERVLDRAESMRNLLRVYGAHGSDATRNELLCGAADGATALADAARLLRWMAADFEHFVEAARVGIIEYDGHDSDEEHRLDAARERWRVKP